MPIDAKIIPYIVLSNHLLFIEIILEIIVEQLRNLMFDFWCADIPSSVVQSFRNRHINKLL